MSSVPDARGRRPRRQGPRVERGGPVQGRKERQAAAGLEIDGKERCRNRNWCSSKEIYKVIFDNVIFKSQKYHNCSDSTVVGKSRVVTSVKRCT